MNDLLRRFGFGKWRARAEYLLAEHNRHRALIHALTTDLIRAMNRGRPCGHITMRRADLPCPHPECWTGGRLYRHAVRSPAPVTWRAAGVLPDMPAVDVEDWFQDRFRVPPAEEYWAWRRK